MFKKYFFIILIIFFGFALNYVEGSRPVGKPSGRTLQTSPAGIQNSTSSAVLGVRTRTANCIAQGGLQDNSCTPGAVFPQATKEEICVKGYSSSVRNVPQSEKDAVYAEYGIYYHTAGQYEVDHLISLELGGSNDISNLWPEAAEPIPGFHQKDLVENYLHSKVCSGVISLREAQKEISANWLSVYNQMPK